MNLSTRVLGSSAVKKLTAAQAEIVLEVGSDKFTRDDLSDAKCHNYVAARNLSAALRDSGLKNLRELYETIPPHDLALPRVGVVALAVLSAAFELKGIGGEQPLETYMRKHAPKLTTFDSVKHQVRKEEEALKRDRRRRRTS